MNYTEFRQRYQWNPKTDKLGEGGFAKVYRATDKIRDRLVVIKIADVPVNHKFSLQREVELNRDLSPHPNIAQYRNCYRLEDAYGDEKDYATMDYFREGSLNVVMNKYLSPDDIRTIIIGMLQGLAHLESENVIHRDFKPGNVLMSRDSEGQWLPKIADFGLSRFTETDITVSNSSVGISYDYAAPEQFRPGSVNRQADLWAFGVIVYRLCTGKLPFTSQAGLTGESRRLELVQLINQACLPDDVAEISEPYQTLIRRCVVKELSIRAKSAKELITLFIDQPIPEKSTTFPVEPSIEKRTQVETIIISQHNVVGTPQPDPIRNKVVTAPQTNSVHDEVGHISKSNQLNNEVFKALESASVNSAAVIKPLTSDSGALVIPQFTEVKPESEPDNKQTKYRILALLLVVICFVGFYFVWQSQASESVGIHQNTVSDLPNSTDRTHIESANQLAQSQTVQSTNDLSNAIHTQPKSHASETSTSNKSKVTQQVVNSSVPLTQTQEQVSAQPERTEPVQTEEISTPTVTNAAVPLKPAVTAADNSANRPTSNSKTLRLSRGTSILVALSEPLSAATAKAGQRVSLEVVKPILVNGEEVISQGANVLGEVANVSTGGKKDMLEIRIYNVRGVGGQLINLKAATFREVGSRNEPLIFKAGQQFIVNTAGAYQFSL